MGKMGVPASATLVEDSYRAYAQELIRYAAGLVGPGAAEDMVSRAFLKVMTTPNLAEIENPRAYLYRAVLNEARSEHRSTERRRKREYGVGPNLELAAPEPIPEILVAVDALSERQRQVTLMCYWVDLSAVDIADTLGITRGSVRRHLGRARIALRALLDSFAPVPEHTRVA